MKFTGIHIGASYTRILSLSSAELAATYLKTPAPDATPALTAALAAVEAGDTYFALAASVDPRGFVTEWPGRRDWLGGQLLDPLTRGIGNYIGHDSAAEASAAFEHSARPADDFCVTVCLNIGAELGLALVSNTGKVPSREGRFTGHIPYRQGRQPCACGKVGCLQTVLSSSALDKMPVDDRNIDHAIVAVMDLVPRQFPSSRLIITGGGTLNKRRRNMLSQACARLGIEEAYGEFGFWSSSAGALLLSTKVVGPPDAALIVRRLREISKLPWISQVSGNQHK